MSEMFTCPGGVAHTTRNGATYCDMHKVPVPSAPAAPTRSGYTVKYTHADPTPAQIRYVAALGGTVPEGATRQQVSDLIASLKAAPKAATPQATPTPPKEDTMQNSSLGIPMEMLQMIREGRYAILGADGRTYFFRLSLIKDRRGMSYTQRRLVGALKIQTQHSDDLIDRALIFPNGNVHMRSNSMSKERLAESLVTILADQRTAAIRYGQELGQCCRCGRTLTDERSRWYGIGPECEQHWPDIIDEVDDVRGAYVEPVGAR